jgi:hypothetical protein
MTIIDLTAGDASDTGGAGAMPARARRWALGCARALGTSRIETGRSSDGLDWLVAESARAELGDC